MEDLLIEVLAAFGYPVLKQGTFAPTEIYPESFFTFWNNDSPDGSFYDNTHHRTDWYYSINFYSTDPELTYTVLRKAKEELKSRNFITQGNGYDVISDAETHTGRGMDVIYVNRN